MKIGIFDSGVGGLTILQAIHNQHPSLDLIYFADMENMPYGDKSKEEIIQHSIKIGNFLKKKGVEAIVIACNTSAAVVGNELKKKYGIPIFDVIDAGVNAVLYNLSKNNKKNPQIGILGTKLSISTHIHAKKIKEKNKEIIIYEKACGLLAPMIEQGAPNAQIVCALHEYLDDLAEIVDVFLLACTHYPLIQDLIQQTYAHKNISIVNSLSYMVHALPKYHLDPHTQGKINIYTSSKKANDVFSAIVARFFPKERITMEKN